MQITLSSEVEQFIRQQIEAGRYHVPDEVVEAAVGLLRERMEALRSEIQKGLDSGPAEPFDPEVMKRRGREAIGAARQGRLPCWPGQVLGPLSRDEIYGGDD
jgi:antitoxin ParD1/3/4